ncbi:hypothetical protein [Moorena sp. SIO4G3]|uniref:hypothetical protein n=1 Tax=Moorena sp. SIO4G3 TaxID=2607821 RepID=UPI0025F00105|nr:hypothetical protein [Moorena sp. SIO4G3]
MVAIPSKPKSSGESKRPRIAVVANCITCRPICETVDHLIPDFACFFKDIMASYLKQYNLLFPEGVYRIYPKLVK